MALEALHVLVEEPSMELALEQLLPRMLRPEIQVHLRQFQCKDELLKQLPQRLAGYAQWLRATAAILVVIDRDEEDCRLLKQRLESFAIRAGLSCSTRPLKDRVAVINRIAIEELEAWFFGDWEAVCAAYPKLEPSVPQRAGLRDPDAVAGGTWEALLRELQRKGYFRQGLRKLELARAVSKHMVPARNRSHSFGVLRDTLAR